jgi:hypothetical protein
MMILQKKRFYPVFVIPAKAGIQNSSNPAPSGTGFRVALRLPGMTFFFYLESFAGGCIIFEYGSTSGYRGG